MNQLIIYLINQTKKSQILFSLNGEKTKTKQKNITLLSNPMSFKHVQMEGYENKHSECMCSLC